MAFGSIFTYQAVMVDGTIIQVLSTGEGLT
jgi:hypothetical protein